MNPWIALSRLEAGAGKAGRAPRPLGFDDLAMTASLEAQI
jgi:hypothetical protein